MISLFKGVYEHLFDFQSKELNHRHYALTVHCLRVLRLLLVSCFSASCSVVEPHLCSKQIKSTWSESLRESALILSWLCSLGETCQHNCCHKSRRTSAAMPRPRHAATIARRQGAPLLLLWPRGALTTITTKNSRLKAILLYNIQWPCYMLLSVK